MVYVHHLLLHQRQHHPVGKVQISHLHHELPYRTRTAAKANTRVTTILTLLLERRTKMPSSLMRESQVLMRALQQTTLHLDLQDSCHHKPLCLGLFHLHLLKLSNPWMLQDPLHPCRLLEMSVRWTTMIMIRTNTPSRVDQYHLYPQAQ